MSIMVVKQKVQQRRVVLDDVDQSVEVELRGMGAEPIEVTLRVSSRYAAAFVACRDVPLVLTLEREEP